MKSKTITIQYMSVEEMSESIISNTTLIEKLKTLEHLTSFDEFRLKKAIHCKQKMEQRLKFANSHGQEYVMLYDNQILNYFNVEGMLYGYQQNL